MAFTLAWLRMLSFSDCKRARVLILETPCPWNRSLRTGQLRLGREENLQVPFHFETPDLKESVRNVFLVLIFSHPLLELDGAFVVRRRQPQFPDNFLKRGRNDGRGLHARFAPIRGAALLCHEIPWVVTRGVPHMPGLATDHQPLKVSRLQLHGIPAWGARCPERSDCRPSEKFSTVEVSPLKKK